MSNFFAAMLERLRSLPVVSDAGGRVPHYPSDEERRIIATLQGQGIQRELATRSAAAVEHDERQELEYWRLWRLIRPADTGAIPPKALDPSVPEHVTLALTVVGEYDAAREEPGAFADCLYRPVSELPYPPAAIRRCCEFLIGIADTETASSDEDHELLAKEREALGLALFSLDYFLDLPANEIPRQKLENLAYGRRESLAQAQSPLKPGAGDVVVRNGSGATDYVSEVIGVGDNDEWMVLTSSGSSMRVVRSEQPGQWDEVQVIAPAAASWLTLTPSGGTPSWEP
ncbi:MAG TPA: hypothetical protein VES88_01410 [Gemmatimonadaceae bacterium]|nr:hypothetical protein [Gemmatimonadaceae bacterium]